MGKATIGSQALKELFVQFWVFSAVPVFSEMGLVSFQRQLLHDVEGGRASPSSSQAGNPDPFGWSSSQVGREVRSAGTAPRVFSHG